MFRFDKEQIVYDIGGVKVGDKRGENPTVLSWTMFYNSHKIIEKRRRVS